MHDTMGRIEVITSVQRRRRWSAAEKQQMVVETAKPGRTVSEVARRFGIAPSQLFAWRRQLLAAATGLADDAFLAVSASSPLPAAVLSGPSATPGEAERIEIVLPSGVVIRVGPDVAVESLRRIVAALA